MTDYRRIPPPVREVRLTPPEPEERLELELLEEELRLGALNVLDGAR